MKQQFIAAALEWLSASSTLDAARRTRMAMLTPVLLGHSPKQQPRYIGISGAPGTGKTTLAGACAAALQSTGREALVISLDDYYLPRASRQQRARDIHPLLARRGVPGTHDIGLLQRHLEALRDPSHAEIHLPLFDKPSDDRSARVRTIAAGSVPHDVFVEGWMIGVPAQDDASLFLDPAAFESSQDADGHWRRFVNGQLDEYQRVLADFLDQRWLLLAPDWTTVINWRWQQELEQPRQWLPDRAAVSDFLQTYRRICDHMQHNNAWADLIIQLDDKHMPSLVKTP